MRCLHANQMHAALGNTDGETVVSLPPYQRRQAADSFHDAEGNCSSELKEEAAHAAI
jgi:hypothetical protein